MISPKLVTGVAVLSTLVCLAGCTAFPGNQTPTQSQSLQPAGFEVSVSPGSAIVPQGGSASLSTRVSAQGDFTGTVALAVFNRSLDRQLRQVDGGPHVKQAVHAARHGFVVPTMPAGLAPEERQQARTIVAAALVRTVRFALCTAVALALASALVATLTIPPPKQRGAPAPAAPVPEPTRVQV